MNVMKANPNSHQVINVIEMILKKHNCVQLCKVMSTTYSNKQTNTLMGQKIMNPTNYWKLHIIISSCHMLIDKALSSDKPNGHWFEADWLHCKRDALSSNRKVDGSKLTGNTQACHL